MKIVEIINEVTQLYDRGTASSSSRLRWRFVYNHMKIVRSRLIHNKLEKQKKLDPSNYTFIPCIKLEVVPFMECPCVVPGNCILLKSKSKLPKLMNHRHIDSIDFVSALDGSKIFSEVPLNTARDKRLMDDGNKYAGNDDTFFRQNGYLYFKVEDRLSFVSVNILLEDPVSYMSMEACTSPQNVSACYPLYDMEFNIDSEMVHPLIQLTVNEIMQIFPKIKQDEKNNSKEG